MPTLVNTSLLNEEQLCFQEYNKDLILVSTEL